MHQINLIGCEIGFVSGNQLDFYNLSHESLRLGYYFPWLFSIVMENSVVAFYPIMPIDELWKLHRALFNSFFNQITFVRLFLVNKPLLSVTRQLNLVEPRDNELIPDGSGVGTNKK